MTQPTPDPGAPAPEPGSSDVAHMWRLTAAHFGGPVEAEYECDLCDDTLVVPSGGIHPAEC